MQQSLLLHGITHLLWVYANPKRSVLPVSTEAKRYVKAVAQLSRHYRRSHDAIAVEEVRDFLHDLITRPTDSGKISLIARWRSACIVGDKLSLIHRAVSWLTDDGLFVANLDLNNCKFVDGRPATRSIATVLRGNCLQYQSRKKLIRCEGRKSVVLPFRFAGADDDAGPNYTGQPAVNSYYGWAL